MKLSELIELTERNLADVPKGTPGTARERGQLTRRLEKLQALWRMDNAEDQDDFNRALLEYLFLKEGVE